EAPPARGGERARRPLPLRRPRPRRPTRCPCARRARWPLGDRRRAPRARREGRARGAGVGRLGLMGVVRSIVIAPIRVYQRVISPALLRSCKYEPTCSHYAVEAIRTEGAVRGVILGAWRILRCNPWSHGGYD